MQDIVHFLQPQPFHQLLAEEGENLDLLVRKSPVVGLGIEDQEIVDDFVHLQRDIENGVDLLVLQKSFEVGREQATLLAGYG